MRPLKPNLRGAFVPTKIQPRVNTLANPFRRPSTALREVDRLLRGETPKICVIRSRGGIGDVIMTTPTVRSIAKKYNTRIHYATDFDYLDGALVKVLRHLDYIEEIFPFQEFEARREEFNASVNLTCPCTVHEKPLAPPVNRIDLFARHAGIKLDSPKLDLVLTPEETQWAGEYLVEHNLTRYKLLMVQPSSSNLRRDAPVEKMKAAVAQVLSARRDVRALIITHGSDNRRTDWSFADTHVLHNFDVRQLAAIMQHCDLVLCPDSAILHVASALSKETVTLFGPTDPHARVNYHPEAVAIWPGKELRNYPCWYDDPKDGYICWKRLEPDLIASTCLSVLSGTELPPSRDYVSYGTYQVTNQLYEVL